MSVKFWQLKFKGTKSVDEIHAAVGHSGANIARIHMEGGETHVYLVGDESLQPHVAEVAKAASGLQEVQAGVVTKLA